MTLGPIRLECAYAERFFTVEGAWRQARAFRITLVWI